MTNKPDNIFAYVYQWDNYDPGYEIFNSFADLLIFFYDEVLRELHYTKSDKYLIGHYHTTDGKRGDNSEHGLLTMR